MKHQRAVGLAAAAVRRERPDLHLEAPAAAIAIDVEQMIARASIFAVGRR